MSDNKEIEEYDYDDYEDDDIENYLNEDSLKKKIYLNSKLNLSEYVTLFNSLTSRLYLSETQAEAIFEFTRLILPENNNLPESYYRLKNFTKNNLIQEIKLCNLCKSKLKNNKCPNETFGSISLYRNNKNLIAKKSIKIIEANLLAQIQIVLTHHYESIVKYRSI